MRVLLIHAARDTANEYKVHRLLAEAVKPGELDLHFLWQDSPASRRENASLQAHWGSQITYVDFGRDMESSPRPTRLQRMLMMARAQPGALARAFRLALKIRPDVIYASQQAHDVWVSSLVARALNKPLVVHAHYNVGPWLGRSTLRRMKRATRVFCVSDFIRRQAIDAGIAPERAQVLHNPADLAAFDIPRSRGALLDAFGLPANTKVIIAAGRIDPSKGHMPLISAFAQVRSAVPEARLLICGGSTRRDAYAERVAAHAREVGVADYVVFAGSRTDLPQLFAGADAMCLPTEGEPFGLVFVEAMAAGLPSVACRSGAVPELINDGESGFLVEVGDIAGLAARLQQLLRDPDLACRLGEAARIQARTRFVPREIATQWRDLLRTIA